MSRAFGPLIATLFIGFGSGAARGHDLWLIPDVAPGVGKPVTVRAHSGMDFPKSEHAPDPAAFKQRLVIEPDGTKGDLGAAGKEEKSGLLRVEPAKPGIYVVAVETQPRLITLEADKFNAYLVSDGLPQVYLQRSKDGSLNQPGKERYSKSPKALMRVGNRKAGDATRPVGLPLEIVPLQDPFPLKIGETLAVRVMFRGAALPEANLGWDWPDDGEAASGTVRTDAKGEALIPIARTGLFTIRLTHMTRPKHADYEWESFWTTLTFRIPG